MARHLDLRAACEAFVSVAERESFTAGAIGAGVTQSVASRRIAALEQHLGARLFERTSRRVVLTEFGRGVLPSAIKLVDAALELSEDAERSHRLPVTVGVPHAFEPAVAAGIAAAATRRTMTVEFVPGLPADREAAFAAGRSSLNLEPVAPDRARWAAALGVGVGADVPIRSDGDFFFSELRPRRGIRSLVRVWLAPEDDVPHVRDRLERVRNGAGLAPAQLRTAPSLITAMSAGLGGGDLVLCTSAEALAFGLRWRALGDLRLVRGYALAARERELGSRFLEFAGPSLAELLQSAPVAVGRAETLPTRSGTHED
ncbi:LysR family transcriptional regulator [Agromyces cerinus]|uniref:DNA-binding transcriptional regulator, LysR family n=1 Tax=Agromyces cerinus subsp. cerinus TaxID=232089 RepID=A0A1N6E7T4_9MICO|nr:LysR family transcriptional regulator [Agromyces cerinus]SIN78977.1 DNA-binding transcriptional regulator, LysR family [Agromyces cerinus subsp. cerinus]